jgi:hypothetical protein
MGSYDDTRRQFKPEHIKLLLIAESPPPAPEVQSSRQFYYTDRIRKDDRLFINTIRALYPEAATMREAELEQGKAAWLRRFQADGFYMIEALQESQEHEVTKERRQMRIRDAVPKLIERVRVIVQPDTKIILIKSNVYDVACEPLRQAGFNVLNTGIVDYPGRFNQRSYREKLAKLVAGQ